MREENRKRLQVVYFTSTGEMYRIEEEYLPSYMSPDEMKDEIVRNRVSYEDMDFVIMDGQDGVRPHFSGFLFKADKILKGSVGFG